MEPSDLIYKSKEDLLVIFREKVKQNGGMKLSAAKLSHLANGDLILAHARVSNAYYGRTSMSTLREYILHIDAPEMKIKL